MMKKAAPGVKKTEETPLETKTAVAEEPTAKVGKTAKELLAALKK